MQSRADIAQHLVESACKHTHTHNRIECRVDHEPLDNNNSKQVAYVHGHKVQPRAQGAQHNPINANTVSLTDCTKSCGIDALGVGVSPVDSGNKREYSHHTHSVPIHSEPNISLSIPHCWPIITSSNNMDKARIKYCSKAPDLFEFT